MCMCVYLSVISYYKLKKKDGKYCSNAQEMYNEHGTTVTPFIYRFSA